MSADDNAPEQAREVEVVARIISPAWFEAHLTAPLDDHMRDLARQRGRDILAALAPIRAAERQEAAREALEDAALAVVADDAFRPSTISRAWGLEAARVIYGLIAKIDDRADGATGRSGT